MTEDRAFANRVLEYLIEQLDIPDHYYELARKRYESLADWLHRDDSAIVRFDPSVYPQGSFRYGTVIRPLSSKEEYDLDLVATLTLLSKAELSQIELKQLVGEEVRAFARAKGVKHPVEEKKRCWRLDYADEVRFHMDILPAVPDDESFKRLLIQSGVSEDQAEHALAITDKTHPAYTVVSDDWPRSNPKGYAIWFENRMRVVARKRQQALVERRVYASVDEVPAYEWKTPLQRAIQILKRHRDVMFRDKPELKPISIIISTLSAMAYQGEEDLYSALSKILDRMPGLVQKHEPRVPNPVNPAEDFADKWKSDARLEHSFHAWHAQASADMRNLADGMSARELTEQTKTSFDLSIPDDQCRVLTAGHDVGNSVPAKPTILIGSAPRPWRRHV